MAAGRPVEGLALESLDAPRVKRTACFFVRVAMLRPGADHYTLLGLEPGFHKDALRDHYRMLIRLTHPDFAGISGAWPPGSATRINLAHDVLSSVVRRAEYDRTLCGGAKRRPLVVHSLAAVLPRPVARSWPSFRVWTLAGTGVAAVLLLLTWPGSTEFSDGAQVAQINLPGSDNASADELLKKSREEGGIAARQAQAASVAQAAKLAQAPQDAKLAQAARMVQAAQEAHVAKLAQTAKSAQEAQITQAARAANEAQVTMLAKEEQGAKLAEAARAARLAHAAKVTQAAHEVQGLKSAQVALSVQEAQAVKVAQVPGATQEVTVVAVASIKPTMLPVPLHQLQPASEATASPRLVDAQPVLNQLMQSMQTGRGEDLLRGLEGPVRQSGGAADFVNAYNLLVGGSRAVRLGRVQLRGHPAANQLAVDGVVQLVLQDQGQPPPVRELQLRAVFAQRDGQVVMTELSAGGARP